MKILEIITPALVGCCLAAPAGANSIQDTHLFRLGVYDQEVDVSAAVTREPFDEVEINFDDVLGMERSTTNFFAAYQWRFSGKWALGVFYSSMSADGRRDATRDFTWNGEEYKAGARVETDFNLDTLLVSASYSFARTDTFEWGLGVGLHAFDIETTLDVEVKVDQFFEDAGHNHSTVLAPLPNLRAYGTWAITPKWEAGIDLGWLSISYDDYDGDYLFFNARTEYGFTKRFGIGLSYQFSEIDVSVERKNGEDKYDMDFYGPSLYLTYGF